MEIKSYPYRYKIWISILTIFSMVLVIVVSARDALYDTEKSTIPTFIPLSITGTKIYYWIICVISILFLLLILFMLWRQRRLGKREILLTDKSINLPKNGYSKESITLPYHKISEVAVMNFYKTQVLVISSDHKKFAVPAMVLPNKSEFQSLVKELENRVCLSRKNHFQRKKIQ